MKASTKNKWFPRIGVALALGGSFAVLMYLSITTFSTPQYRDRSPFFRFQTSEANPRDAIREAPTIDQPLLSSTGKTKIVLRRNRGMTVGKVVLTYRGLEDSHGMRFSLLIPELDSEYTYTRVVRQSEARQGFRVGGERFVLLSANNARARLLHLASPR